MVTKLERDLTEVEPAIRQIYERSRNGDRLQILYVDDHVVLLRGENSNQDNGYSHVLNGRNQFDDQVEAGFLKLKPDAEIDMTTLEDEDWSEVNHIGAKTANNLHDGGFKTKVDVQQADDDELLQISGLGATGLVNLREFTR